MVGVLTSKRCDNCRKRKKKCGEQRPSCAECIRSGWDCPGYAARWKFMDETPRLAKLYSQTRYVYDMDCTSTDFISSDETNFNSMRSGSEAFALENSSDAPLKIYRFHDSNPLATTLVYCLSCKVKGDLVPLWLIGSFFQYTPSRLGHNCALDDAISCICSLYCDRSSNGYTKSKIIYQNYIRALYSLRKSLAHEHLRFKSETLCASLLLQMCELAVNVDKGKWGNLARGTAQLIQARGVYRYTDPFDLGILESQLSYIVVQSAKSEEECFLHQPEWRVLLATTSSWPGNAITSTELKSLKLRVELCRQLFELPSILKEASSYNNRPSGLTSSLDPILTNKTHRMYSNMKTWLHHAVEPHLLSTPFNTTHNTIQYPDIIAGVVDCVANTTLLTLDRLLCLLYHANISTHPINKFASPATVESWCRRASTAFEFVQTESTFAAKPLGIGMSQFQSSIPKPLAMMNS